MRSRRAVTSTARSRSPSARARRASSSTLPTTRGLRLGCSPSTILGEAQQTAAAWIRDGRLGTVRAIYADVSWGRIETWHPAPAPFFDVGVLVDVGGLPADARDGDDRSGALRPRLGLGAEPGPGDPRRNAVPDRQP